MTLWTTVPAEVTVILRLGMFVPIVVVIVVLFML